MNNKKDKNESTKAWLKRLGWGGILFFIIKGTISTYLIFKAGSCALT